LSDLLDGQVVLFVDLLGFSEFTSGSDTQLQQLVLALLTNLASLKSDFVSQTTRTENGTTHDVRPSISTFSDHIVASYSLARIEADESVKPWIIMAHLSEFVARIAISALSLGFLVRGSIAFGKLYHSGGVVFGQALAEAVALESRTAIFPRVILSERATVLFSRHNRHSLKQDFDGIEYVDYYRDCVLKAAQPEANYSKVTEQWFNLIVAKLHENLQTLTGSQRAKWFYFSRKLRSALEMSDPEMLKAFGVDLTRLPKLD
jgi:hypothetical protein